MPQVGFDFDMRVIGEQDAQSVDLLVGEQVGAGVQRAPRLVERVTRVAVVAVDRELHSA